MKLRNMLKEGIDLLTNKKIDNADFDATEILLSILDMNMAEFLNVEDIELEERFQKNTISKIISNFDEMIYARSNHYPLQYLLGEAYFCGLRFFVNKSVLIPRQDTEVLVEKVIEDNPDKNKFILDLCTGSGCIAISLASLGDYKFIVGTDISSDAIRVAAKNAEDLIEVEDVNDEMSQRIYFMQSDLFGSFDKLRDEFGIRSFDIITANPPYIRTKEIERLADEIKRFEPTLALDGDVDGLKYYRKIAEGAREYLSDGGKIYLEIGYDQGKDIKKIFEDAGYTHIETVKDLGKNDRVMIFSKE